MQQWCLNLVIFKVVLPPGSGVGDTPNSTTFASYMDDVAVDQNDVPKNRPWMPEPKSVVPRPLNAWPISDCSKIFCEGSPYSGPMESPPTFLQQLL